MSEFLKEGQLFDEKYKIIKQIGKGGMSIVYLAENIRLGTKWAIKVARKDMGEKVDLLAEPNILKNLKHEALPRIIDIISNDNRIYIVEDYIEGTPLNVELKNQEKFSEKIVVEWAKQICNVLEYLHKQKPNPIIYRDMKPSNIILSKNKHIKLIDFGIAREYKEESEGDTTYIGTKGYAAPEQYGKAQSDARTDIYSLGITLYHLITGKSPLEPPYEIKPVREFDKNLSEGIEYIINKCTKQDPLQRYQSVNELLSDLNNIYKFNSEYKRIKRRSFIKTGTLTAVFLMFALLTYIGYLKLENEKLTEYNSILAEGKKYESENKNNEAIAAFSTANNKVSSRIDGYKEIAKLYLKSMDYDKCINYINNEVFSKLDDFQNDDEMLYILGTAQFEKKDYENAAISFEKAKEINEEEINYYRDLAVSYARSNKLDLAQAIIKDIKSKGLDDSVTSYISGEIYSKKNDFDNAITMYKKCINETKDEDVKKNTFISIAEIYRDNSDKIKDSATKEVEILEQANSQLTEKNNLLIQEMLGQAYFNKANNYKEVDKEYKDNLEKSLGKFNMLVSSGVNNAQVYSNLGIIYQYLEQYEKSEASYLKMKELSPEDMHSYIRLTVLYIEMANKGIDSSENYQKAKTNYNYIIQHNPKGANYPEILQLSVLMKNLK